MKRFVSVFLIAAILSLSLCVPAAAASLPGIVDNGKNLVGSIVSSVIFIAAVLPITGMVFKRNWIVGVFTLLIGAAFSVVVGRPDLFTSIGGSIVTALLG